jgi:hypothetical protein
LALSQRKAIEAFAEKMYYPRRQEVVAETLVPRHIRVHRFPCIAARFSSNQRKTSGKYLPKRLLRCGVFFIGLRASGVHTQCLAGANNRF